MNYPAARVQCCIAGGGPAGMMLGLLLGRAGVKTLVLEKHADFLRDFRGDTVHPSTLRILEEMGLLDDFLQVPHSKIGPLSVMIEDEQIRIADFSLIPGRCNFIALMPQWDFLNFLALHARRYPSLQVAMSTQVTGLTWDTRRGAVTGVKATAPAGPLEIEADLVVGCDGRRSTVREAAGLIVEDLGSPIDVLWFRLSRHADDPANVLGRLGRGKMLVTIDRSSYWQCAFVIAKGGIDRIRSTGIASFRTAIAAAAPFLADRLQELKNFDDVKLLTVAVDRLNSWSRPGLLCIGDAAHAMSPVGGVGINLAIQDAVATANLLTPGLLSGKLRAADLDRVRRRRLLAVSIIQRLQVAVHTRMLYPVIASPARHVAVPLPLRLLDRIAMLRRWPAQLLGMGIRPEHVRPAVMARQALGPRANRRLFRTEKLGSRS